MSEDKKSKKRSQSEFKKKEVKNLINPSGQGNNNLQVFQNQFSPSGFQPGPLNFQGGIYLTQPTAQVAGQGYLTEGFDSVEKLKKGGNNNARINAHANLNSYGSSQMRTFSPNMVQIGGYPARLSPLQGQPAANLLSSYAIQGAAYNPQAQMYSQQAVYPQAQVGYSTFSPQQVFNAAASQQQIITSNQPIINTHSSIKGESYFEQVPFETVYVEQIPIQKVEYVPLERRVQEYIALEHQTEYVPKTRIERKVNYQPVDRTEYEAVKKTEYVPVEKVNYVAKPIRDYVAVQDIEETVEYKPVNKKVIHYPKNPDGTPVMAELNNIVMAGGNTGNVSGVLYNSGVTSASPFSSTYLGGGGNYLVKQVNSGVYAGPGAEQYQVSYVTGDNAARAQQYALSGPQTAQYQIIQQQPQQQLRQQQYQYQQQVGQQQHLQQHGQQQLGQQAQQQQLQQKGAYQQQNARTNNFSRDRYQQQFAGATRFVSPDSDFRGPTGKLFKEDPVFNVHQSGLMGYHDPNKVTQPVMGIKRLSPGRFNVEKYEGGITNTQGIKVTGTGAGAGTGQRV